MKNTVYTVCGALLVALVALADGPLAADDSNPVNGAQAANTAVPGQETPADVQEAIQVLSNVRKDIRSRNSQQATAEWAPQQPYFARQTAATADNARDVMSEVQNDVASRIAHPVDPDSDSAQSYFERMTSALTGDSAPSAAKTDDSSQPSYVASAIKVFSENGVIRLVNDMFEMQPAPVQPVQPIQPALPTDRGSLTDLLGGGTGAASMKSLDIGGMVQKELAGYAQVATGGQGQTMAATDSGSVLSQSNSVQNVAVQHRNPVSQDPYVRGYKGGQIYTQANGVYWTPARRDLDTMLSKIDPGMMQDLVVVPGPYGLRYGPGLAFIDVVRTPTPRCEDGFQSNFDTTGNVRSNGGQLYGRETVSGGSSDWGYRMSYGDRGGSDYSAGDGTKIPSSFHNRDVWGELSYDINPHQRLDIAYQRLDQTDTEYPCEFFDIDYLGTYGFEARVVDTDPLAPWSRLALEGWYNRTGFRGSTPSPNPAFPVIDRVNYSLTQYYGPPTLLTGTTQGAVSSSGARVASTFGDADDAHVNVGADFRYLEQVIGEHFDLWQGGTVPFDTFNTNMPHAWMRDPGIYAEWAKPVTDAWTTAVGARMDFVATRARASDLRSGTSLPGGDAYLTQDDTIYAFYCNNTYKLDEQWTLSGGFGHGQRPPTLIERYADGLFISSLQSGFTRMIGDPRLKAERNWQLDLGLSTEQDKWRGKANVFQSWVIDYVTYEGESVIIPGPFDDARLLRYVNTPVATLTGFELYGEYDWTPRISPFGRLAYVSGRDQTLDAPLPAISPFDSTVGLRFHDADNGKRWGFDVAARMVATQNQLGMIRGVALPVEERTPGFTTCYIRGYWNYTNNLRLIAGIDNLFNRNYQEHLDLRLQGPTGFPAPTTRVLAPGISPYFGVNWVY